MTAVGQEGVAAVGQGGVAADAIVYDVIVVGAGAAGAPLAARVSEDPAISVLLLEAGPVPRTAETFPADLLDAGTVSGARADHPDTWAYAAHLRADRPYTIVRGRILGGSTTTNGGYFVRARRADFDRWSTGGNTEWTWDAVLPYYRRLENDRQYGESAVHGGSGPVSVTRPSQEHAATRAFRAAAIELGFGMEPDKNDQGAPGYGAVPTNVRGNVRWNTGLAYILPALGRSNLTVVGDTTVRRVVIEGGRAVGVETARNSEIRVIRSKEIILCAGGIESPHLLMLSGIGPRAELERAGITVLRDAPGVGTGFSDHPQVVVEWVPTRELADPGAGQWLTASLNVTSEGSESDGDVEILQSIRPLEQLLGAPRREAVPVRPAPLGHPAATIRPAALDTRPASLAFLVSLHSTSSRGRIGLDSADPTVPPTIDYHYLSTEPDRRRMREAVRLTARLLTSRAFAPLFDRFRELDAAILADDARLDAWVDDHLGTSLHLSGSARLGRRADRGTVVDQYGSVHGIAGLRVADTSILPTVPLRGPAATAVLIGEMMADFVKRDCAAERALAGHVAR